MKHLGLVIILAVTAFGRTCGQSIEDITSITFTKQSRGYLDEVIISRDSVQAFVENHRAPEDAKQYTTEMEGDSWVRLMASLSNVSLADIDGLQSPTMNRAHDGALHSSIVITLQDGTTITHSFDDENPHPDLKPLLDVIREFRIPTGR